MRDNSQGTVFRWEDQRKPTFKSVILAEIWKMNKSWQNVRRLGSGKGVISGHSSRQKETWSFKGTHLTKAASVCFQLLPCFLGFLIPRAPHSECPELSRCLLFCLYHWSVFMTLSTASVRAWPLFLSIFSFWSWQGLLDHLDSGAHGSSPQTGGYWGLSEPHLESSAFFCSSPSPVFVGARTWEDCKLYTLFPFWLGE